MPISENQNPVEELPNRRASLIQAAFDIVAEAGFEGLRTRAVADRAGVNVATLHYYFPTKQALIGSLSEILARKFVTYHAPDIQPGGRPALDRLRQEFADSKYRLENHLDLMTVMHEVALRAKRDPDALRLLETMAAHWRVHTEGLVRECVDEGTFRADTNIQEAATALRAILAGLFSLGPGSVDNVAAAVEAWLVVRTDPVIRIDSGGEE